MLDTVYATCLGPSKFSFYSQAFNPCLAVEKASTYNMIWVLCTSQLVAFQNKTKKGFIGLGLHEQWMNMHLTCDMVRCRSLRES